jgi:hypothetical protein
MAVEEQLKNVKEGVSVIVEVIKAAGDNPKVKEAGGELGKTALTLTKAINNILLPVAAVNFAFDKAKVYFANQFPIDIAQKATGIPQEKIVEPKASIAGPALQGLAFSHEEKDLKEMYLNLLVSAMDDRAGNLAHPAFVEIIKQLNAEEAKLLQTVLASDYSFPIAEIYFTRDTGKLHLTVNTLYRHLLDSRDEKLQPIGTP